MNAVEVEHREGLVGAIYDKKGRTLLLYGNTTHYPYDGPQSGRCLGTLKGESLDSVEFMYVSYHQDSKMGKSEDPIKEISKTYGLAPDEILILDELQDPDSNVTKESYESALLCATKNRNESKGRVLVDELIEKFTPEIFYIDFSK